MQQQLTARHLKISELIKRSVASLFSIDKIFDHIISSCSLSVTEVRMSQDFKYADIYIYCYDVESPRHVIEFLNAQSKHVGYLLAKSIKLRKMPSLKFIYDASLDKASKIDDVLASLNNNIS
jgi:ribosome-binding factor A